MADDTGLAPKESVIETLRSLAQELAAGGFRVFASIPKVRLRRGGLWITSRDAAGRSLPGILFALAFVIAHLPYCRFWFANCAGRI